MNPLLKRIDEQLDARHVRLFFFLFVIAILARGGIFLRGFAVDDYSYGQGFSELDQNLIKSQGRLLLWAIDYVISTIGVNLNDIYWSLAGVALALQAALVVSVLRFVGGVDKPGVFLAAALMVAHPYLAEILTFRMVLPGYCLAALLTIIALEALQFEGGDRRTKFLIAVVATIAMLFIYQGFLNYLATALVFSFLFGWFSKDVERNSNRRNVALLLVCVASAFGFLAIMGALRHFGGFEVAARAKLVQIAEIPTRISQFGELIARVYWRSEAVSAAWPKIVVICMMAVALIAVLVQGLRTRSAPYAKVIFLGALVAILPLTPGVILLFSDWWPVPRVLVQVSLITGLVVILGWAIIKERFPRVPGALLAVPLVLITVSFIFKNNQIFADQQRLNAWDAMKVNRIISRLEQNPEFSRVQSVVIGGGKWAYPAHLSTIQGDLNISALFPGYTKNPLLVEISGYNFKLATSEQRRQGEEICKQSAPWPSAESVMVRGDLAIVCLGD